MGGGGSNNQPVPTSTYLSIDPQIKSQLMSQLGTVSQGTNQFAQNATQAAGQYQPNFSQYVPQLQTQFQQPNFSQNLDTTSQNLVSQGLGNIASKQAGANAQVAQQFHGQPGAAGVLQSQNAMQGALAGNQLPFQAMQGQQAREAQQFELGQNAQNLSNSAALQQGAAGAAGQSQSNAGLTQQLQLQNAGLASQQNVLATLGGLAGLTGVSNSVPQVPGATDPLGGFDIGGIMNPNGASGAGRIFNPLNIHK